MRREEEEEGALAAEEVREGRQELRGPGERVSPRLEEVQRSKLLRLEREPRWGVCSLPGDGVP